MADEAAGHPLFIDALVRHTADRSTAQIPLRLSDALWARIAELDASARHLLALAAVAGWPLPREILIAAAELPGDEIDPALTRLRHAHLVRAADSARKDILEPYHDRVREAVLEHLDPELRKACHRALAGALLAVIAAQGASPLAQDPEAETGPRPPSSSDAGWSPEAVGVHLRAAGDLEQAARYLVLAADQAAAALAFDRAARLYREALAIDEHAGTSPGPLGDTRDVLARLARALVNACRGGEAAAVYLELARRADATGEADLELRLCGAEQLLRSGHWDDGRRVLAGVLDELDLRPPSTRVSALWRFWWRRAWVRLRGLGSISRSQAARVELPSRERLRLEACRVAWASLDVVTTNLSVDSCTRYQVLALKTADPRYVGLALAMEVYIAVVRGDVGTRRTARLLESLAAAAAQSGDPFLLGHEKTIRAVIDLTLGQWARGREHGTQAVQVLRERGLGVFFEIVLAAARYSQCLLYMGSLRDFMRELQALLREAEERGDDYTLGLYSGTIILVSLMQDQPKAARQQVERGMARWTMLMARDNDLSIRSLHGQIALAQIDLYEGDGAAAYRRIDQDWYRRNTSPYARSGFVRAWMLSLHGMATLAACRSGKLDRRLVRAATRDARALRAMRMPWTDALARILEAGVALVTGAHARGREQLERAHTELTAAGMSLHATLARRRLGELDGGAEGAHAIAEADAWLAAQGVRVPERLARVFMPEVAPPRQLSA